MIPKILNILRQISGIFISPKVISKAKINKGIILITINLKDSLSIKPDIIA